MSLLGNITYPGVNTAAGTKLLVQTVNADPALAALLAAQNSAINSPFNSAGGGAKQQLHNHINQQFNAAYAARNISAQQMHSSWIEERYMIDGKFMSLTEFVNFIWPEDHPDKTFFLLRHTKDTNNGNK